MNLPSGLVFYLDFQYGTDKQIGNSGDVNNTSLYGNTSGSGDAGGLYGAGRFTYSENQFSASLKIADSGSAAEGALWYSDLGADSSISSSVAAGKVFYIDIATSGLTNPDLKGVKGFNMSTGSYLLEGHSSLYLSLHKKRL